jgi:rSAM/selenodomain-associated transferase 2
MKLSIIVPSLNEGAIIESLLCSLQGLRRQGHEVLLSDGGSSDNTVALAKPWIDQLVQGKAGRAVQMNRAAACAQGDVLWFIHADTAWQTAVEQIVQAILNSHAEWGFCQVRLAATPMVYRIVERLMNWRSCFSRVATGDQGIFIQSTLFQQIGGYANIPLMEDIEVSKRLRQQYQPACLPVCLLVSARRWQQQGVWRTILLMWRLRLAYFFGVSPQHLVKHYHLCNSQVHKS